MIAYFFIENNELAVYVQCQLKNKIYEPNLSYPETCCSEANIWDDRRYWSNADYCSLFFCLARRNYKNMRSQFCLLFGFWTFLVVIENFFCVEEWRSNTRNADKKWHECRSRSCHSDLNFCYYNPLKGGQFVLLEDLKYTGVLHLINHLCC